MVAHVAHAKPHPANIHVCIYICTPVCIYTHLCVYIHTCLYIHTPVCIYTHLCVYIHTCVYICTPVCTYAHLYVNMHTCMYIYTPVSIYARLCVYVHTCVFKYTQDIRSGHMSHSICALTSYDDSLPHKTGSSHSNWPRVTLYISHFLNCCLAQNAPF